MMQQGQRTAWLAGSLQTAASSSSFYLYVKDVDEQCKQALAAGAVSQSEPTDQLWGDRMASVKDSFGNT